MKISFTQNLAKANHLFSPLLSSVALVSAGVPGIQAGSDRDELNSPVLRHRQTMPSIVAPSERFHGKTYAQWSAEWWRWFMEYPVDDPSHPHPFLAPDFHDVGAFQDFGNVWFLAGSAFAPEITLTIPRNKALFFPVISAEVSSLEASPYYASTAADQRDKARFFADHYLDTEVTIDGVDIQPLSLYRVQSPQFTFHAPTPWISGTPPDFIGGTGTAVADGYYLLLKPLPKGEHTISTRSIMHFDAGEVPEFGPDPVDLIFDFTYHLLVD